MLSFSLEKNNVSCVFKTFKVKQPRTRDFVTLISLEGSQEPSFHKSSTSETMVIKLCMSAVLEKIIQIFFYDIIMF